MEEVTRALDLGSGRNLMNPFECEQISGMDLIPSDDPWVKQGDAVLDGLPWKDNYFDVVTAFDFLEHVPRLLYVPGESGKPVRREPFVELMHDIHRVLKPGGILYARTPAFPEPEAFQDPTHVNIITWNTLYYFLGNYDQYMTGPGFSGKFKEVQNQRWDGAWLVWYLQAEK